LIQKKIIQSIATKVASKVAEKKMLDKENIRKTGAKAKEYVSANLTTVKNLDDLKSRALTTLFYVGGSYAMWRFLIKPAWQKYRLNQENNKVFTNKEAQQASILRQAIIGAGTDENAIMRMARQITDWKAVQKSYNKLTGNNLNEDLKDDLSSSEYNLFITIVNRNSRARKEGSKRGYIVISNTKVRIRNTPDSTISAYSFSSNILTTADARVLLGFATGKFKVDSRGVQYYQVRIKFLGTIPDSHEDIYDAQKSRILTFWVGAGAIDMFRTFKQMRQNYPSVKIWKGTKDTGLRQALK